ncbi:MAG: response regulator transcription factor [Clostridiales bacterium]|nr:response regulator transcription factor [Clostridiales bacterium]
MVTILVVEDDAMVRLLTKTKLSQRYRIVEAANGQEALNVLDHEYVDLLVVDIQMPVMNGYELMRTLREAGDMTPAIMLTAMNTFAHKKEGFAAGVDDYMTKPIDYDELIWRIEAILRRAQIANEKKIVIGDFSMEQDTFSAQHCGKPIALTNKEFQLLYKLLSYPNVVFTKQQLMDEIWGYDTETEYDTIKTYISRLRSKCADCAEFELASIRGLGYRAVIHKTGGTQNET